MPDRDILILKGDEVSELLLGREHELIDVVRRAYAAHATGDSSLPFSSFLRFPNQPRQRIIALPAFLGADFEVAGVKWIASFPGNLSKGMDRASALIILSSPKTGQPQVIIEGSVISAKRTAASAALAASLLQGKRATRVGVIGCGLINFEVVRFLLASSPEIADLLIFDLDPTRAIEFKRNCQSLAPGVSLEVAKDVDSILQSTTLISMATTALQPHIADLSRFAPGCTLLHVSLRDLTAEAVLASDNVVDDIDHVCREQTSIHLAEQLVGNRNFIRCTLADVMSGQAAARRDDEGVTVFSPFGLGVLDIAVGQYICQLATLQRRGTVIDSFLPEPWSHRNGNGQSS